MARTGWRGGAEYAETLLDRMMHWQMLARQWMTLSEDVRSPVRRAQLRGAASVALYASHEAELQFLRCGAVRERVRASADSASDG